MPRILWPLVNGSPVIELSLVAGDGTSESLSLLADTGAGAINSPFEMILNDEMCGRFGGDPGQPVTLRGAYQGSFPVYVVRVRIPSLEFDRYVRAVAVANVPQQLNGIACFRLLSRFGFGNFGNSRQFGLEV